MIAVWKDIQGFEGKYQISNFGNVKSLKRKVKVKHGYRSVPEKLLSLKVDKDGYYTCSLSKGKSRNCKHISVHRLVAIHFIDNPENKPQINHIDGVKKNNHVSNLEWCTASENIKHAFEISLKSQKGSRNNLSKLNEKQVKEIREKHWEILKELGVVYNVSTACINDIIKRRRWKHL